MLVACASSVEEEKFSENDFSGLETVGKAIFFSDAEDHDLAYILNYARLTAENTQGYHSEVKIYSMSPFSECRFAAECSELGRLYIAARIDDTQPGIHALYLSPEAFSWKFLRWVPAPSEPDCKVTCAAFEVEGEEVVLKNGKMIQKAKFEIGVSANPFVAYIKQIE